MLLQLLLQCAVVECVVAVLQCCSVLFLCTIAVCSVDEGDG